MKRYYTAESVTEGHPDKVCDQIADAILDECLKHDPSSRVACEVLATRGNVFVAGEISSGYEPPVFDVIRKVLGECGYCTDGIEMDTFVHQQSPDIAKAVSVSKEFRDNNGKKGRDRSRGAGDQGVMVGYACDETAQLMPMPIVLAHRITRELSACRRSGYIKDIFSDGKAQVTVEYAKRWKRHIKNTRSIVKHLPICVRLLSFLFMIQNQFIQTWNIHYRCHQKTGETWNLCHITTNIHW